MFRLAVKVPRKVLVGVSGGADSMAALDFLRRNHDVTAVYFNHGTQHGAHAEKFVTDYTKDNNIKCISGGFKSLRQPPKGASKEDYWRNCRYEFFAKVTDNKPIVLAHNLDDAVETWLFTCINGNPNIIPMTRGKIIRPFILSKKDELRKWCLRKNVPFLDDPSNENLNFSRIKIRKLIIPEVLKVNPGIYKVVAKKYLAQIS